jgi:hypothetical protein
MLACAAPFGSWTLRTLRSWPTIQRNEKPNIGILRFVFLISLHIDSITQITETEKEIKNGTQFHSQTVNQWRTPVALQWFSEFSVPHNHQKRGTGSSELGIRDPCNIKRGCQCHFSWQLQNYATNQWRTPVALQWFSELPVPHNHQKRGTGSSELGIRDPRDIRRGCQFYFSWQITIIVP